MRKNGKYLQLVETVILSITDAVLLTLSFGLSDILLNKSFALSKESLFVVILIKMTILMMFNLYSHLWQYASINAAKRVSKAILVSSVIILLFNYTDLISLGDNFSAWIVMDWALSFITIGGSRFSLRLILDSKEKRASKQVKKEKKLVIIGAGDAGNIVLKEIKKSKKFSFDIAGFVDDKDVKQRKKVDNIPILGKVKDLSKIVEMNNITNAIIAIPSASGKQIRNIVEMCEKTGVEYKITPGLFEIISGKVSVNQLRSVNIDDLLGRKVLESDLVIDKHEFAGHTVLVSGAGGSIGSELCRQICQFNPGKIILLDHSEFAGYSIQQEIETLKSATTEIKTVITDIRSSDRLKTIFENESIHTVFHAAAYKHVPLMEDNVPEVISNNILGSRNLMEMSVAYQVKKFILISTDKAVRPTNVMGASKRLCEVMMHQYSVGSDTIFSAVRFGNVLGSQGSVVPLFKKQIKAGGPVTVTDPKMTRYFMTIPEAVRLVINASNMANGGEIFILDMGEPVNILNVAKDLIRLSGLDEKDIDITFTGLRPGEKLYEELSYDERSLSTTDNPKIKVAKMELCQTESFRNHINNLIQNAYRYTDTELKMHLFDLVEKTTQTNI